MTSKIEPRRLMARFGIQLIFTAAVTLASLIFLLSPTTSARQPAQSADTEVSHGRITVSLRTFDPATFDPEDYNDRPIREVR